MLKGLFSPDNPVIRFMTKLGYVWWLNILWLVTSLPVFTIGASTTALVYASMKLHESEGYVTRNFFHSFKENFRQATLIWLIYLAAGILLALDLIYWNQTGNGGVNVPWALSAALCILYGISFCYVFAIQSKFVNPVSRTILYSFLLPFRNLKETIMMVVIAGAVIYFNVTTIFAVNFITMNIGIGVIAYIFAVYFINIFGKYIPEERAQEENAVPSGTDPDAEEEKDSAAEELLDLFSRK